ncbi:MAG: hypothetical protein D6760_13130 [Deltaproteobacteria bacterium]|nr:MAG: hypothetical protein D6760_13130 [Deltaproteobacteria bacterium]
MSLSALELPLLPRDDVLLFPGTTVSIRVTNTPARTLFEDALRGGWRIGLALRATSPADALGVHAVGCAGEIRRRERLTTGTWRVVVRGVHRFRIRAHPHREGAYCRALVQILYEAPVLAHEMRPLRDRIRAALEDYERAMGVERSMAGRMFSKLDVEGLVNHLCIRLPWSPLEKQRLLECATLEARCHDLVALIHHRAAEKRLGLEGRRGADT